MIDLLVCIIIAIILAIAIGYIIKEKKAGTKCIGCASSKSCNSCGSRTKDTSANNNQYS